MSKLEKVEEAINELETMQKRMGAIAGASGSISFIEAEHYYCVLCDALELLKEQELQREYEAAVEEQQYCERYEPTYNPDDGSM